MKYFSAFIIGLLGLAGLSAGGYFYLYNSDNIELTSASSQYQLIPKVCWFDVDWRKTIKCFHLKTPLESGEFYLPVVIIKYEEIDYRKDPVLYLQGGPGAGAGLDQKGMERWLNWFDYAGLKRDLILMDPRGTGKSLPIFNCSDNGQQIRNWKENLSLREELQHNNRAMLDCFSQLQKKDPSLDPVNFSSQQSATDILHLMRLLQYQEWNILGVSYGSRLALEVERQNKISPFGLRSLVLDSVYPAGYGGVQTWPSVLNQAIENFLDECSENNTCYTRPVGMDLRLMFSTATDKLKTAPLRLTIRRWDGEAPIEFLLNDHRFISIVFAATYDPRVWPNVVYALKAINNYKLLEAERAVKQLVEPYLNRNLNEDFNSLAYAAVDCADNFPGTEADYQKELLQNPFMASYANDQWQYQLCHKLANQKYLIRSSISSPVLLIAGRLDPVTPVSWAEIIHRQSPSSQLVIREELAHSVLSVDTCLLQNLYQYFDNPIKFFDQCR